MKKILDSKALYVVLSVLISVGLWFYVTSLEGNELEDTISGIQIQFEGLDILEEKNLFIQGDSPTVSLRIRGPSNILARLRLNPENISATINVSRISTEGITTLAYNVTYPSYAVGSVSTVSRTPNNVTFTVARYLEREIEITGKFTGSVAEGYVPGGSKDFRFSPSTIRVSGEMSLVNQIRNILVTVDGEGHTESIAGEYPFQLIGNDGTPLEDLDVECSAERVYTTFPIQATKEVPLVVAMTPGGGINESNVTVDIQPVSSITVAGSREDVDAISEITLRSVDLAAVRSGDSFTVEIPLRDELENLSGTKEVTVTFHFSGVTTKSVETTNIRCINVPVGWQETLITQAMTVELRGPLTALAPLTGSNVQVIADLSGVNQAPGQYTVTPKIYIDNVGSDAGYVDNNYRVVVSLTRRAD